MTTFKDIIKEYDRDTLEDMTSQGCVSGCASGLIYYQDTNAYYDQFANELHEALGQWIDEVGETPEFITKELGNVTTFKNAVVWFVAELYAHEIINSITLED